MNKSIFNNGKLTGFIIVLSLLFFMSIGLTSLILLVIKHDTTDKTFKDPMWNVFYWCFFYVGGSGLTAMAKRGWDFIKILFNKGELKNENKIDK